MSDTPAAAVPYLPWRGFRAAFFRTWRQGEHVSCIGPTGAGKSTLVREILPRRRDVMILGTKPRDDTLDAYLDDGFVRVGKWSDRPRPRRWYRGDTPAAQRLILWPPFDPRADTEYETVQAAEFRAALRQAFAEGAWCVVADDVDYIVNDLRLSLYLRRLWKLGRAGGNSLVVNVQRPRGVPLDAYSQASHLFLWQTNDEADLDRIGGIGGMSARAVRAIVASLPRHEALYVNTRTRDLARTRVGS